VWQLPNSTAGEREERRGGKNREKCAHAESGIGLKLSQYSKVKEVVSPWPTAENCAKEKKREKRYSLVSSPWGGAVIRKSIWEL